MTDALTVTVEGDVELRASLARVAAGLDDLPVAGTKAGQAIKQRASSLAPKDTGALSRSIRAQVTGAEVVVSAPVRYAAFQEFGTVHVPASPYMAPALDAATGEVVAAYADAIQDQLETVKGA